MVATIKPQTNQISARGNTADLEHIREFVKSQSNSAGFGETDAFQIALAVDEACSNLIRHSYNNDETREFVVTVEVANQQLIIKIMDNGVAFDPLSVPEPNMNEYFKKFKHGGLGVFLMRKVMTEISYQPALNTNSPNILTLTKHFI
ncbi:MAG: ATP-binding protein [Ignavibacteria bacterium]|nr:ATP-binding protein [Ignavibacteria bacterium]